ncbi:MAG TPA: type II secretion system secretin GspD, partial [Enterobacteriaceae bacterium]|nr:type II secretion system secretin GspD [Enterobacteriaceae bacterium]
ATSSLLSSQPGASKNSDPRQGRIVRPTGTHKPPAAGSVTSSAPVDNGQKVTLNFRETEISAVTGALSRFFDRNFLMDPRVKGQITLVSDGEVNVGTAWDMMGSALRMRGFTIVDVGNVSRVVPVADARLQGGAVNSASPGGGISTRTYRLAYESAEALLPVIKPMVAAENSVTAYPANNTLVVTDYAENLERIARIIESIDTPTSLDTKVVKVYNGVAVDIAALANDILQQQGGSAGRQEIAVLADPRSNSVVIRSSSPSRTALASDLIIELDNVQEDPGNLHVVYLRNAQAVYLSRVLRGLLKGDSGERTPGGGNSIRGILGSGGMASGAGASGSETSGTTTANSDTADADSDRFSSDETEMSADGEGSAFSANGVTVQADASTNTLIISAPEPMYRSLRQVIDLLDQRRAQVLVESLIVEVTANDASELGVQWMQKSGRFIGGTNLGGTGLNLKAGNTIDALPGGLSLGVIDGTVNLPGVGAVMNLEVLARALQTRGGANILSTPNLLTLDNEAASIMVGKTVPFVSGQYITSGSGGSDNPFQTVEREDIGLKLRIRPQISEGGTVKLDIYQEVSSIDAQSSGTGGIVTNKRALDTSVLLDDGQIMVLGGLLEDSVSGSNQSVPVLGSIPLIGALFRYDSRQRVKTNLMVFLRPYVIRDANASRGLTLDRYNYMRSMQSATQPGHHPLLPDMAAPILPPAGVPVAGSRADLDLRTASWDATRQQQGPQTTQSVERRALPAVTNDSAAFHTTPDSNKTVIQAADVRLQDEAVRIASRVRVGGLPAYIVSAPGGAGYAVRVDVDRDAQAVDASTETLRELGYHPELVVTPR